jgi:FkbH-like protein
LKRRGILLAIVSRNTEQVALEAIDQHPAMVLRREDFAAWRINWSDKAQNVVEIAAELNLGIDSIVFIDDDPTQRSRLREALPQVYVPEWPESKLLYSQALQRLTCFDQVAASTEDTRRTAMYQEEKGRQVTMTAAGSREAWLNSLRLRVTVDKLNAGNLKRTAQLLNKTNQMNLATRRLSEPELFDWAHSANNTVLVASVADVFGEYGLTGIVSFTMDRSCARIVDFVMSCRVMDRGVEEALLYCVAEAARRQQLDSVKATLVPTTKNVPCKLFFDERSGFEKVAANDYAISLRTAPDIPDHLTLECANLVWSQFEPLSSRTG